MRITDSKHNCSRTADLSMAASTNLALKLRGSADPVPPFHPPPKEPGRLLKFDQQGRLLKPAQLVLYKRRDVC